MNCNFGPLSCIHVNMSYKARENPSVSMHFSITYVPTIILYPCIDVSGILCRALITFLFPFVSNLHANYTTMF